MLVILSGVAGAGKDTIKKELIERMEKVESLPSFNNSPTVGFTIILNTFLSFKTRDMGT